MSYADMDFTSVTVSSFAPFDIECGRCHRPMPVAYAGPRRDHPEGWFELSPGDWRCGCILKQQPEGEL